MPLSDQELDQLHWLSLNMALPRIGVAKHFPSIERCRDAFISARWPDGVRCPRCDDDRITWIDPRTLFQCENCRHQFSTTSGSALHRTRVDLMIWFVATEEVIRYRSTDLWGQHVTTLWLAERLGVPYVTAHRTKRIIISDLRIGGDGLLGRIVCTEQVVLPTSIAKNSKAHLNWLIDISHAR